MDLRYHPEPNDTLVSIFGDSCVRRLVECDDGMILPIFLKTEPVKAKSKIHKAMREEKKTYIYKFTDRYGSSESFETETPIALSIHGTWWSCADKLGLSQGMRANDGFDYNWKKTISIQDCEIKTPVITVKDHDTNQEQTFLADEDGLKDFIEHPSAHMDRTTNWIDFSWKNPKKNHRDMTAKDSVVEPDYYKSDSGFEVADIIDAFKLNFNLGNVVKYTIREKEDKLQDLRKARWYIDREIQRLERTED